MNKRGSMLSYFLEVLLAVIIIGILVVGILRLSSTFVGNQKELQAKGTLDNIVKKLNSLEVGERDGYILQNPASRFLVAFDESHNENQGFTKQAQYMQQNALCICEKGKTLLVFEKKECKICQTINLPLKYNNQLAFFEIKIADLSFSNEKDYYNMSLTPTIVPQLSEQEKQEMQTKSTATGQQISANGYDAIINDVAKRYWPEVQDYVVNEQELADTIKAMITIESQGSWNAIGTSGEIGLIQIMPQNALALGLKIYDPDSKIANTPESKRWDSDMMSYLRTDYVAKLKEMKRTKTQQELIALDDRFNAAKNLDAGARLLIKYIKEMKNKELGIMAYNAGAGGVRGNCQPLVVTSCKTDFAGYKYLVKIKSVAV